MNNVAKNIKRLRKSTGLSQDALGEKLCVTRQAVSNWETGRTQPDIDMLMQVAAAFNVSINEVVYGSKPNTSLPYLRNYKAFLIVMGIIVIALAVIHLLLEKQRLLNPMPIKFDATIIIPLLSMSLTALLLGFVATVKNITLPKSLRVSFICISTAFLVWYFISALDYNRSILFLYTHRIKLFRGAYIEPLWPFSQTHRTLHALIFTLPGAVGFLGWNNVKQV